MRIVIFILLFVTSLMANSQGSGNNLYKPDDDAEYELSNLIKLAKAFNRNVFVQVGGNWCAPCLRFNNFITSDEEISSVLNENYVVYHLNYSKENQNMTLMEKYDNPQKMNFPVFLILDTTGKLLHTQKVMDLVNSLGYDKTKVIALFNDWKPSAIKPVVDKTKDTQ